MTSLRLKSRIQRLERQMQAESRGPEADPRLVGRFQAALQREAEIRENEARLQREKAA